jgi:hypothetical protein
MAIKKILVLRTELGKLKSIQKHKNREFTFPAHHVGTYQNHQAGAQLGATKSMSRKKKIMGDMTLKNQHSSAKLTGAVSLQLDGSLEE